MWQDYPTEEGFHARHILRFDYDIVLVLRDFMGLYMNHPAYGRCRLGEPGFGRFMKLPEDNS